VFPVSPPDTAVAEAVLPLGPPASCAPARGTRDAAPAKSVQSSGVRRRDAVNRRLLVATDLVCGALALVLTVEAFGDDSLKPVLLLALPLVVVVAKLQGLYDRDALVLNKLTLDEAPKLFQAATLYALLISVNDGWLVAGDFGPRQTVGVWAVLFGTALIGRTAARILARRLTPPERILVIGTSADASRLAGKLTDNPTVHATIVGRVPLDPSRGPVSEDVVGRMEELETLVGQYDVHRVIVAPSGGTSETTLEAVRNAKALGVQVSVLPRLFEVVGSSVEFDQLYGVTLLGVRRFGLSRSSTIVKRALDLGGALAALIVLGPVMAIIAVAIKRTSPGPVLFRQRRIGRDGDAFQVLKFRTMVVDAEARKAELQALNEAADGLFKIAEDPRVTAVGRLLRRTSLDELPQLFNVLRGEMSLVGPRPLVPDEDRQIEGRHRRRLHLKPGMTGQWQIFGSSRIPLREMVTIDYLYVANWTLWADVKILCRTLPYMLARRGL
jgi:exopolysaccharide biosynthesis polyprenyl glycosylphosphotransferase